MKLNLVADYDVGGKKSVTTFAIDNSNNLVGLREMCALEFPVRGRWKRIPPSSLLMCESKRKAEMVADAWKEDYKKQGRLFLGWWYNGIYEADIEEAESEAAK